MILTNLPGFGQTIPVGTKLIEMNGSAAFIILLLGMRLLQLHTITTPMKYWASSYLSQQLFQLKAAIEMPAAPLPWL